MGYLLYCELFSLSEVPVCVSTHVCVHVHVCVCTRSPEPLLRKFFGTDCEAWSQPSWEGLAQEAIRLP